MEIESTYECKDIPVDCGVERSEEGREGKREREREREKLVILKTKGRELIYDVRRRRPRGRCRGRCRER